MTYNSRLKSHKPLLRKTPLRSYKPMNNSSIRQDWIDKTLDYIRNIKRIETGHKCQICGRHQDNLPLPLSIFHILDRAQYPRIITYRPNLLLACWSKQYYMPYCHTVYHNADHDSAIYKDTVKKIEIVLGKPLSEYKDELKIADKIQPKMSLFQCEQNYFVYKSEFERLSKGG